jgi:hypothetical protein
MEDRKLPLPAFDYYLDESDPDVLILRRQDDSFVAAFSTSGATREGIVEAVKEDYWELARAHAARQGQGIESPTWRSVSRLSRSQSGQGVKSQQSRAGLYHVFTSCGPRPALTGGR